MTNRRIIGLLGPRGVGKDTAAAYIQEILPGTISVAFADPIRAMLGDFLGLEPETLKDQRWKEQAVHELKCTGRKALNRFGEGMKALFHKRIWVNYWRARIAEDDGFNIVVPDVRTEYEINAVIAAGGELWHVCGNGKRYTEEIYDSKPSARIEDKYLLNYGGLLRFKANIRQLLNPGKPVGHLPIGQVSGVGPQIMEGSGHD